MLYMIASKDGILGETVEADSPAEACDLVAQKLGYIGWDAMLADIGYSGRDFTLSPIRFEAGREYDTHKERKRIKAEGERATLGAWRRLYGGKR